MQDQVLVDIQSLGDQRCRWRHAFLRLLDTEIRGVVDGSVLRWHLLTAVQVEVLGVALVVEALDLRKGAFAFGV